MEGNGQMGRFSLFLAGVIVIIFMIGVGAFQVTLPLEAEEVLEAPIVPTSLFIITLIGEFLLFPGFLALYFTLRDDDRVKTFMATALGAFSVVMFLASRGLIISLSQVSGSYMDATTVSGKAAYLAAAELALETQNVYSTLALIFLSLASILIGLVMLRGEDLQQAHKLYRDIIRPFYHPHTVSSQPRVAFSNFFNRISPHVDLAVHGWY